MTLFVLFLCCAVVQIFFWSFLLSRFAFARVNPALCGVNGHDNKLSSEPVSVIISARNDLENLKKNLSSVLAQNYHEFEVVVVNDRSTDGTKEFLESHRLMDPHLKVIHVEEPSDGWKKKQALEKGIAAARYNLLLFTDADCRPASKEWIQHMAGSFNAETDIVIGFGGFEKSPHFINHLVRYDNLLTAVQYFSYALTGMPYMGVGRNLAYRKSFFMNRGGFSGHRDIPSGDDDLTVNRWGTGENTAVQFHPLSHTVSSAKNGLGSWFSQKSRHFTTGSRYKTKHKILLAACSASAAGFWLASCLLLFMPVLPLWALMVFSLKTLVQSVMLNRAMRHLQQGDLFIFSQFLDAAVSIVVPLIYFSGPAWKTTNTAST